MDDSVLRFYGELSDDYHLLFEDWRLQVVRQGELLDGMLCAALGKGPHSLLDCCCGIGTQAIGLALRSHRVQGTDLNPRAVDRARREAQAFGVSIPFAVADVRTLGVQVSGTFDAVLACDNALPHLLTDEDLQQAANNMAARLRAGGVFLASTRDYDEMVRQRQRVTPPRVFDDSVERRIVFQVWDWTADWRSYQVNQFIVRGGGTSWQTMHYATWYRALLREELSAALRRAGLEQVTWHRPEDCGYYQPVVTAHKV